MATSSRIVYIGSAAHEQQVRQAAGLAGLMVDAVQDFDDGGEHLTSHAAVVVAGQPFADLDPEQFLEHLHRSFSDCLAILHLRSGSAAQAVRLTRLGAYSCYDDQITTEELAAILGRAQDEIAARQRPGGREPADAGPGADH